jgi:hypothetical protein
VDGGREESGRAATGERRRSRVSAESPLGPSLDWIFQCHRPGGWPERAAVVVRGSKSRHGTKIQAAQQGQWGCLAPRLRPRREICRERRRGSTRRRQQWRWRRRRWCRGSYQNGARVCSRPREGRDRDRDPSAQRDVGCRWDYVGCTFQPALSKWVKF